ncbi:MAG: hypothetical protein WAL59_01150, partial [Roseiarcus sp.]
TLGGFLMTMQNQNPAPTVNNQSQPNRWDWIGRIIEIAFLGLLVVIGFLQVCVYNRQAGIMDSQTKIIDAQQKLGEASERAWTDISKIEIGAPITFDTNGARVTLNIGINNTGHIPATDISTWISPYVGLDAISGRPDKRFAPPKVSIVDLNATDVLFPSAPPVTKSVSGYVASKQISQLFDKKTNLFPVVVEVCVTYKFTTSPGDHKTCRTIILLTRNGNIMPLPDKTATSIPVDDMTFRYQPNGSTAN